MDYNKTINLPKTDFPMRAGLPKREPEMLKRWEEQDIYHEMLKKNEGKPLFNLHDGPPFSNGSIHMGTAMNTNSFSAFLPTLRIPYKIYSCNNKICPSSDAFSIICMYIHGYARQLGYVDVTIPFCSCRLISCCKCRSSQTDCCY